MLSASLPRALTRNLQPIPVLVYHQIDSAPPKGRPFRSLVVSPSTFARQMRLLKWLGYTGLSMTGLQPYLSGDLVGKVVGITFDDGYLNNLTYALPVLMRHGFSSTCYAVSSLLGKTNVWDAGVGIAQTPLMNEVQLRQWVAGGQEVGSHTQSHINLLDADDAACQTEIAQGQAALDAVVNGPITHFCYPFGRYAPRHVDMVNAQGFVTATTTQRSRCHAGMSLLELPRVPVLRSTSLPVFWLKLASRYEDKRRA